MIAHITLTCILMARGLELISSRQFRGALLAWAFLVIVLLALEGCRQRERIVIDNRLQEENDSN